MGVLQGLRFVPLFQRKSYGLFSIENSVEEMEDVD